MSKKESIYSLFDVEPKYSSRVSHFIKEVRILGLPKSIKATRLLLEEMSSEKGFSRFDGRDYFEHPIAVAQTILDFKIIGQLIANGDSKKADIILATSLLHDVVEDVPHISLQDIRNMFGVDVMRNVDNVTKRKDEEMENYIKRFMSEDVSCIVKISDRLHNTSTLDESSLEHRKKQYLETSEIYLPLTKVARRNFWEYGDFFFQARLIITSILKLIVLLNEKEEYILSLDDSEKATSEK